MIIQSIMRELNKIVDVVNRRKVKFVFKHGIIKAMWYMLILCIIFAFLETKEFEMYNFFYNTFVKIMLSIIPGIVWGLVDYEMYKNIVNEDKKFTITNVLYVFLNGFLGWGILCGISNITFFPYNSVSVISAIITIPIYGVVLGGLSRKFFNTKGIRQLYQENIKGKNIQRVERKKNLIKMK